MYPHSKTHKGLQQDQSSKHLNTSAKAKYVYTKNQLSQHLNTSAKAEHFYMTKHPNHHEATNITCIKSIYSLYIPSVHKKNTSIAYTASIIKTVLQQEPSQTTHSRTITIQIQHILNFFRTSNTKQLQILPATTHSRTTSSKSTIPAPRILHMTIPTDTRTPHTASILHLHKTIPTNTRTLSTISMLSTSTTTTSITTIYCMK